LLKLLKNDNIAVGSKETLFFLFRKLVDQVITFLVRNQEQTKQNWMKMLLSFFIINNTF